MDASPLAASASAPAAPADPAAPAAPHPAPAAPAAPVTLLSSFDELERLSRVYTGGGAAASHDGSLLLCLCGETISVLATATGRLVLSIPSDADDFTALALHPSAPQLIAATRSRQLHHLCLSASPPWRHETRRSWKAHKMPVLDLAYDPTGTLIASASADGAVMVFDVDKGFCTHVFRGHTAVVHRVLFHPDADRLHLFSSAADNVIRVWDLRKRTCLAELSSHVGLPAALAVSPCGGTLLSGGRDQVVNLWSLHDYTLTSSVAVMEAVEGVLPVAAPKGKSSLQFITAGDGGLLRMWDASGRSIRKQSPPGGERTSLPGITRLTRCGEWILSVTDDHNLVFHKPETLAPERCVVGYNEEITDLKFIPPPLPAPDDAPAARQVAVGTNSSQIRLLDLRTMDCRLLYGHRDLVLALDVSADGVWLASASKDCTARVWHTASAACHAICEGHVEALGATVFLSKSAWLLTGSKDKTVKLWDLPCARGGKGKPRARSSVLAHAKDINALAVAPNDKMAASGSQDRTIKLWSVDEGQLDELAVLKGHKRAIWSLAFSPIDKVLASSSGDMTIKVWSVTDGACIRTFEGHTSSVLKVHWVCRGLQLLSSSSDGLIKLWTVKSSECAVTLDAHEDKVWALDYTLTPDGIEIISGSADSVIVRWRDCSAAQQQKGLDEAAERLELEQELSNAVFTGEYSRAMAFALKLRQPRALRTTVEELLRSPSGEEELQASFGAMDEDELTHCLQCARDWNTTAQHSLTAHRMVHALLQARSVDTLAKLPRIKELVESMLPYSERHFERLDRLVQASHFLSYTLTSMQVLLPPLAEVAPATGAPTGAPAARGATWEEPRGDGGDEADEVGVAAGGEADVGEAVADTPKRKVKKPRASTGKSSVGAQIKEGAAAASSIQKKKRRVSKVASPAAA